MPPTKSKDGEPKRVVLYIRFSSWKQDAENTKPRSTEMMSAVAW